MFVLDGHKNVCGILHYRVFLINPLLMYWIAPNLKHFHRPYRRVEVVKCHEYRAFTWRISSQNSGFWCFEIRNLQIWPDQCEIWHGSYVPNLAVISVLCPTCGAKNPKIAPPAVGLLAIFYSYELWIRNWSWWLGGWLKIQNRTMTDGTTEIAWPGQSSSYVTVIRSGSRSQEQKRDSWLSYSYKLVKIARRKSGRE